MYASTGEVTAPNRTSGISLDEPMNGARGIPRRSHFRSCVMPAADLNGTSGSEYLYLVDNGRPSRREFLVDQIA